MNGQIRKAVSLNSAYRPDVLTALCVILLSLSRKVLETQHDRFLVSPYVPHSQLPFVFHSHAPITSAVEITSLGTSNSIPEYIIYRTIVQTDTRVITAVTVVNELGC